jgi:primosomal replication protein N
LLDNAGLRHTPAGIAALRLKVAHTGRQDEARRQRTVEMETELVAFGQVAEALAQVPKGRVLKLAGFLDRKSAQSNQLELHVTEFGIIEE